jgi:hypothetical protein
MTLTKTDFIAYLDSPLHLWAIKHGKLDQKELNAYVQHLFQQGYDVESHAEKYIQEYLIHEYKAKPEDILLQPSHIDGNFEARTDVLIKNPETNKWDMYEVKSSTKVEKTHKYDATFQFLVFKKKYDLGEIFILHLNKEYIRQGDLNLKELFTATNITEHVEKLKEEVHLLRYEALETMQEDDSDKVQACIRPKTCPCLTICHKDLPKYSIYDINHLTASEKKIRKLEEMGIKSVYDVPNTFELTEKQQFQVDVAKNKQASIDTNAIKAELDSFEYPLYFVDYESFNPAIPMYDGYKPYDQMPFQWSLHILREEGGELEHHEFIETEEIDPIPNFMNSLKNVIGDSGSIIVWNETFEATQNKRMAEIHPEFSELSENMNSRIYDLMLIFRDNLYADPKFKGSYSIKKVLPVLVPELTYNGMEIGDGATAMASWDEMVHEHGDDELDKQEGIRENLLRYCELDTLAMVRIWEALHIDILS